MGEILIGKLRKFKLIDKKSIEVIGNIYENPEYKIGGCEAKYYVYDIK